MGGSWKRGLLAFVIVLTAGASLFPFSPDLPSRLDNGALRRANGLDFPVAGIASVPTMPAQAVLDALESGPVHVDLTVQAAPGQDGPARILSLSDGIRSQSLMVGQSGSSLVVRVRRTSSSPLGAPGIEVPDVFDDEAHEVRVRLDLTGVTVSVDGRQATEDRRPEAGLANWDPDHRLVLGNEHGGARPWLGRLTSATMTTAGGTEDLVAASILPAAYWRLPDGWTPEVPWYDPWNPTLPQLAHALAFFALGWLAAQVLRRLSWSTVALGCAAYAVVLLAAKSLVAGRHPSLADLLVEVGFAVLGVLASRSVARGVPANGR